MQTTEFLEEKFAVILKDPEKKLNSEILLRTMPLEFFIKHQDKIDFSVVGLYKNESVRKYIQENFYGIVNFQVLCFNCCMSTEFWKRNYDLLTVEDKHAVLATQKVNRNLAIQIFNSLKQK